jgi:hypothetical protein
MCGTADSLMLTQYVCYSRECCTSESLIMTQYVSAAEGLMLTIYVQ